MIVDSDFPYELSLEPIHHFSKQNPLHPLTTPELNYRISRNPQIPIVIVWERVGCFLGIEPNEHQIPRFPGKYSYHTDHSENPISSSSQIYQAVVL